MKSLIYGSGLYLFTGSSTLRQITGEAQPVRGHKHTFEHNSYPILRLEPVFE